MTIETRPYQEDAVQAARKNLKADDTTLLVMATGLGKTTVFIEVAKYFEHTLIMAHRKELIEQAAGRVQEQLGITPGIEMGPQHAHGERIIIGSVQTLVGRTGGGPKVDGFGFGKTPLVDGFGFGKTPKVDGFGWPFTTVGREIFDGWKPDLIIIDEAHHSVASTYMQVLKNFPSAKVLGVTATPDRTDQKALGSVFNSVAYRYETPQAIDDGWLSPISWATAESTNDLLFCTYARPTVIFTPTVQEAKDLALKLPNAGVVFGAMKKKERTKTLNDFKARKFQYMVNCNILTEGFDCPEIECVAMYRRTQSRGMFVQCLGRGLRKSPGKSDCLYLDLAMNPEHSLEGPPDPLDGVEWVGW